MHNLDFISPRNVLVLGNDRWEDDVTSTIDFEAEVGSETLSPGDDVTAIELVSTRPGTTFAARAVGTSRHPADLDGDGSFENAVEYRFEHRPDNPTDTYNLLPDLSTTAPFGEIGNPIEMVPGAYVGPVYSFRITVRNRSNKFDNPVEVPLDEVGVTLHGRVLRETDPGEVLRPVTERHRGGEGE